MNVSAEMYIVVSLMFAVFAAVAAVGTSIVLGVGFERLRAGFEIVKRQSGFFADAIYRLDERTKELGADNVKIRESLTLVTDRVERTEKTTAFFSDAIHTLEQKILAGSPAQAPMTDVRKTDHRLDDAEPILPRDMEWISATDDGVRELHTDHFLRTLMVDPDIEPARQVPAPLQEAQAEPEVTSSTLPGLIMTYFRGETRGEGKGGIVYH